jgi:hypothetical protein
MITLPDLSGDDALRRTDEKIPGILVFPEEGPGSRWIAECLETGLMGVAKTPHEAVENLERNRASN